MTRFDFLPARRLVGSAATLALALLLGCNSTDRSNPAVTTTTPAPGPDSWQLLDFVKADTDNPIMGPSPVGQFTDPILN